MQWPGGCRPRPCREPQQCPALTVGDTETDFGGEEGRVALIIMRTVGGRPQKSGDLRGLGVGEVYDPSLVHSKLGWGEVALCL